MPDEMPEYDKVMAGTSLLYRIAPDGALVPRDGAWAAVDGRPAHKACADAFNSTIASGVAHGDCGDPGCCLSRHYAGPKGYMAGLRAELEQAWAALTREQRAYRLGQPLEERHDGACTRYSHILPWGHVGTSKLDLLGALLKLRTPPSPDDTGAPTFVNAVGCAMIPRAVPAQGAT